MVIVISCEFFFFFFFRGGGLEELIVMVKYSLKLTLPASFNTRPNSQAVTDVISLGLATTVFPVAIAGAILNVNKYSGKFHGVISPATPTGMRDV